VCCTPISGTKNFPDRKKGVGTKSKKIFLRNFKATKFPRFFLSKARSFFVFAPKIDAYQLTQKNFIQKKKNSPTKRSFFQ